MALNKSDFLLSIWSFTDSGEKVYPYKGERGKKKGLFSVNFTNDTNNFEGLTEEELVSAIESGKFRDRGTVRMLPLDYKPGAERNAFAPKYFDGVDITCYPIKPKIKNDSDKIFIDENVLRSIKSRRGQSAFRNLLLEHFDSTCCISGSKVIQVLEAAHIYPHADETNYTINNGLLLRSDIHTLFDLGLIKITELGVVKVLNSLNGTEYERFNGIVAIENVSEEMICNIHRRLDLSKS